MTRKARRKYRYLWFVLHIFIHRNAQALIKFGLEKWMPPGFFRGPGGIQLDECVLWISSAFISAIRGLRRFQRQYLILAGYVTREWWNFYSSRRLFQFKRLIFLLF